MDGQQPLDKQLRCAFVDPYIKHVETSEALVDRDDLPYNLKPRDFRRAVEDIHELLHDINVSLTSKGYGRLEEFVAPAAFSGFISNAAEAAIANNSRALVTNQKHNGYPDLLPDGIYPNNATQHGTSGGLEVKATRYPSSWQAHGPREGWFCVLKFGIDTDEEVAVIDRSPTTIQEVLVAQIETTDWNWQPAKEGKIRSGTASMRTSGRVKLRSQPVWVRPEYQAEHDTLLLADRKKIFGETRTDLVVGAIEFEVVYSKNDVVELVAQTEGFEPDEIENQVATALRELKKLGLATQPKRGHYLIRTADGTGS